MQSISAVVPTLNEADRMAELSGRLCVPGVEWIVSDGGSSDGTPESAARLGAKVVRSPAGRGMQMNAGAKAARGEILFFLHADARVPPGFDTTIREILRAPAVAAGAFRLEIAAGEFQYRLIEMFANARSRLFSLPYGDQGFFILREQFERAGGFSEIPIMEDVEMARRCRRFGRIAIARESVKVSARRWQAEGWKYASVRNLTLLSLFLSGVPAEKLKRWYR